MALRASHHLNIQSFAWLVGRLLDSAIEIPAAPPSLRVGMSLPLNDTTPANAVHVSFRLNHLRGSPHAPMNQYHLQSTDLTIPHRGTAEALDLSLERSIRIGGASR